MLGRADGRMEDFPDVQGNGLKAYVSEIHSSQYLSSIIVYSLEYLSYIGTMPFREGRNTMD